MGSERGLNVGLGAGLGIDLGIDLGLGAVVGIDLGLGLVLKIDLERNIAHCSHPLAHSLLPTPHCSGKNQLLLNLAGTCYSFIR